MPVTHSRYREMAQLFTTQEPAPPGFTPNGSGSLLGGPHFVMLLLDPSSPYHYAPSSPTALFAASNPAVPKRFEESRAEGSAKWDGCILQELKEVETGRLVCVVTQMLCCRREATGALSVDPAAFGVCAEKVIRYASSKFPGSAMHLAKPTASTGYTADWAQLEAKLPPLLDAHPDTFLTVYDHDSVIAAEKAAEAQAQALRQQAVFGQGGSHSIHAAKTAADTDAAAGAPEGSLFAQMPAETAHGDGGLGAPLLAQGSSAPQTHAASPVTRQAPQGKAQRVEWSEEQCFKSRDGNIAVGMSHGQLQELMHSKMSFAKWLFCILFWGALIIGLIIAIAATPWILMGVAGVCFAMVIVSISWGSAFDDNEVGKLLNDKSDIPLGELSKRLQDVSPVQVTMHIECYHMVTQVGTTTGADGSLQTTTYQVPQVTHRAVKAFAFSKWADVSGYPPIPEGSGAQLIKLRRSEDILFMNSSVRDQFDREYNQLVRDNTRDESQRHWYEMATSADIAGTTLHQVHDGKLPWLYSEQAMKVSRYCMLGPVWRLMFDRGVCTVEWTVKKAVGH